MGQWEEDILAAHQTELDTGPAGGEGRGQGSLYSAVVVVEEEPIVVGLHWIRWLDQHSQMLHKLENPDQ